MKKLLTIEQPTLEQLQAESINQLYRQSYIMFFVANFIAAMFMAYLFRNSVSAIEIGLWLAVIYLVFLARIALIQAYRQHQHEPESMPRWERRYFLLVAINGIIWDYRLSI